MPPHLKEVFHLYEVPEDQRAEIIRYVALHPDLPKVLLEAVPQLEKLFGNAWRCLILHLDPEEGWEELFGVVLVKGDLGSAHTRLKQFGQAWFLKLPSEVRIHLSFTVRPEDVQPV